MGLSNSIPNAILQEGVCTSTTRPANPYKGQTIYETDTGSLLVYYGATTGWRPPWGQPWGFISLSVATSNQTGITTIVDVTSLTSTWTAVANRYYRIAATIPVFTLANAAGIVQMQITDAANNASQKVNINIALGQDQHINSFYVDTFSTGSVTRKVRILTTAGTGAITASTSNRPTLLIEDIGPATSTAPTS